MKAIIPTGGRGTRMLPLTYSANKHAIPVGNKPLIYYAIDTIAKAGIKDVALTYNPGQLETMKDLLGDGSRWGLKFTYICQEEPKGLANIFQVCEEWVAGDSFLLHLGDNIFTKGINNLVTDFEKEKRDGLIAIVHHKENTRLGVPYFDKEGKLIKYVEKPKNPPHDFAIPGIYLFQNGIYDCFKGKDKIVPSKRGELEISSAFQWLLDKGKKVGTLEIEGEWLDPGKIEDWLEANRYLLDVNTTLNIESKLDKSVKIVGRVHIGKNCKIKNSVIKGPVEIGDNVQIENSQIAPFCSVYHNCVIKNSTVGDSVLMDSVIIENVKKDIENSLIGSNTIITQSEQRRNHIELLLSEHGKITL